MSLTDEHMSQIKKSIRCIYKRPIDSLAVFSAWFYMLDDLLKIADEDVTKSELDFPEHSERIWMMEKYL